MTAELLAAGREPEPRNGLDGDELQPAATAAGLRAQGIERVGTWTLATPPWCAREHASDALLSSFRRGRRR